MATISIDVRSKPAVLANVPRSESAIEPVKEPYRRQVLRHPAKAAGHHAAALPIERLEPRAEVGLAPTIEVGIDQGTPFVRDLGPGEPADHPSASS